MNFSLFARPPTRARRTRRAAAASEAKLPRFEAHEGISVATIAASEFFVVGGGGDRGGLGGGGGGGGGLGHYGDYARSFGQPHTIANGYASL